MNKKLNKRRLEIYDSLVLDCAYSEDSAVYVLGCDYRLANVMVDDGVKLCCKYMVCGKID